MRFCDTSSWTTLTTNSSILIGKNTLHVSFLDEKIGLKNKILWKKSHGRLLNKSEVRNLLSVSMKGLSSLW